MRHKTHLVCQVSIFYHICFSNNSNTCFIFSKFNLKQIFKLKNLNKSNNFRNISSSLTPTLWSRQSAIILSPCKTKMASKLCCYLCIKRSYKGYKIILLSCPSVVFREYSLINKHKLLLLHTAFDFLIFYFRVGRLSRMHKVK